MSVKLRWKTLKSGRKSAFLDIYYQGQRHYEFLKIYTQRGDENNKEHRDLAEKIRATRQLQIEHEEFGFIPAFKKDVNFIQYFEAYLKNYKKKDVRKVRYSLKKFKEYIGVDILPFKKVSPKVCEGFKDYLISPQSGLSGETPYDYWKRFKGVLKKAKLEGIIKTNSAEDIQFKGYQKYNNQLRKQVLTKQELQALAQTYCGNEMVKRAFLFACYTGLGIAEIRKLTWGRIING
ncbi:MAG: site-specific integrase, partial [Bacteroidota bacterium]